MEYTGQIYIYRMIAAKRASMSCASALKKDDGKTETMTQNLHNLWRNQMKGRDIRGSDA
jgi:hypothetical protein